ncbi:metallophosphoesterase [Alkalihalobacterium bogoriense]|uniref:metallophosphoesterase n=1 Tax=Alkalihalobacterium bogoriense TaxID=246272 RepID=UPI0004791FA9|nr:metallophosphoesterase [Alkalihalobacterium bogoriense]
MKKGKKKKWIIYCFVLVCFIGIFFYVQNNAVETTEYTIQFDNIPTMFDQYKIVQLSDLHSKWFGQEQKKLIKKVEKENPDLIVFTGDLVDSKKYDEQASLSLMAQLVAIAPVYFVTGNHEWWSGKYSSLEEGLLAAGVHVLRNEREVIKRNGEEIVLFGIDDPAAFATEEESNIILHELLDDNKNNTNFTMLLAHRPELFSTYAQYEIDLIFSGHAHGGQVRFPFIGGLVAPNQGFLPTYDAGMFTINQSTMIVNRGLGNSIIPLRIFNRPEIVVVTLVAER